MSYNTFGHMLRVTTFGESHGPAIGCVVDGCPPRITLAAADIQAELDRRRPGTSRFTTQRREPDEARILSGVMNDERTGDQVTTGTPIAVLIDNVDPRSKDYGDIKDRFRPGHADWTYEAKYGIRDFRGGGRSSARETASRVAAGAIARKIIPGVRIRGALIKIGKLTIQRENWDWDEVARNPFFAPDAAAAERFADYLDDIRRHEKGSVDPLRDLEDVETELILSDLVVIEKRLERLDKDRKKIKNPELDREFELLETLQDRARREPAAAAARSRRRRREAHPRLPVPLAEADALRAQPGRRAMPASCTSASANIARVRWPAARTPGRDRRLRQNRSRAGRAARARSRATTWPATACRNRASSG